MVNESPEEVFFKYSYSCSSELYKLGLIKKEINDKIQRYLANSKIPDRKFLETTYPNAIRRIKELAIKLNRNYWDVFVIRKYFLEEHNIVIERKDGNYAIVPEIERELCKVRKGKIVKKYEVAGKLICYDVDFGDKTSRVIGKYYTDANVGDIISTHWNFAIEKID